MALVYIYVLVFVPGIFCITPCDPGFYGEHCDKQCNVNCRAHVNNQSYCDIDTGACSLGCISGLWGSQCNFPCSKNCMDRVCVQQTGQCSKGCTENYRGDLCEEYIETKTETPTKEPPEETHTDKYESIIDIVVFVVVSVVVVVLVLVLVSNVRKYIFRKLKHGGSRAQRNEANHDKTIQLLPAQICSHKAPEILTDLHDSILWGDICRVKSILSKGQVDKNSVDTYGRTPVMWSARQKQKEVFDYLVKSGADLSLTDKSGNNILHSACNGGHMDIVRCILLKRLVDINSQDIYGRTAVMMAATRGYRDVFDLLVRDGADLSLVDDAGNTVLHAASLGGQTGLVENVLSHITADINTRNKSGETAAMVSKENDKLSVYDLLVSRGCAEN
ncbi:uncharacterized protein LOC124255873 [Haliotis rubra]|uniref:uncharacterized protein LOC124255873 n=1 Tax=Haliotis rubra TaxID=36100 RepID=UPI001EE5BE23|nr:uncharacterized protein LOC124255873 [Haliotis rubra]